MNKSTANYILLNTAHDNGTTIRTKSGRCLRFRITRTNDLFGYWIIRKDLFVCIAATNKDELCKALVYDLCSKWRICANMKNPLRLSERRLKANLTRIFEEVPQ